MSGNQGHAYPPGQGPPHPSQSAYPPPMPGGFVPPPGGQPGYGPPPGQPGYGAPPPGQPGYGVPPPGQPGYGAPGQFGYGAPPGYGGVPGYGMPPPAYGGPPPPGVGVPPGMGYPGGAPYQGGGAPGYPHQPGFKQSGNESDDSQPGDPGLRSKGGSKRIKCTFVNHSDTKVILCKIDERGKCHKVAKMKDGKKEVIETSEGDVFVARGKGKKKKKRHIVINNNALYAVTAEHDGDDKVHAEILRGPDCLKDLSSEKKNDVEVKVKFINRSKKTAQLVWMNHKGKREKMKTLAPGKCYTTKTHECNFWIAHDIQNEDEGLYMNYSYFYSPWKTRKHKERVLITQDRPWGDSSGSSSSDSD